MGTGEESPFTREELNEILAFAEHGIQKIIEIQKEELGGEIGKMISGVFNVKQG